MQKAIYFLMVWLMLALPANACNFRAMPLNGEATKGKITISGAFALYPLVTRWAEEFQTVQPGVRFGITSSGAGKGMADILAGKVDIGMISREVAPEEVGRGAYSIPVAQDAVFPLINTQNPVIVELKTQGLKREILIKIFITGEITTWGQAVGRPEIEDKIHVYTRSDICGAATTWSLYLGGQQSNLLGKRKFGDPGVVRAIQNDPFGIGYNNLIYAYGLGEVPPDGTTILPIDLNENGQADPGEILTTREKAVRAIRAGLYPTPPARILYLVTNGKPAGAVQAFLVWTLTNGQEMVEPTGYVQLSSEQLDISLQKIR